MASTEETPTILEPKLEDTEDQEEPASNPLPATFNGRLNLSSFAFASNSPQRSSPRLQTSASSSAAPKRKSTTTLRPPPAKKSSSPSPAKKPRTRTPSSYAPPSKYAHLSELPDVLAPSLFCIFIGLNPGLTTAATGHAYSHPSNLFWKLLYSSGLTPDRKLSPTEDGTLPEKYGMGNTNIVSRPTRNGAELAKKEMDDAVAVLEDKVRMYKPESVCIVGKSIWESVFRVRNGRGLKKGEFEYGWQEGVWMGLGGDEEEDEWKGARVFVATSTSGLAATVAAAEKERIWRVLGDWVNERRRVRAGEEGEVKIEELEGVKVEDEDGN